MDINKHPKGSEVKRKKEGKDKRGQGMVGEENKKSQEVSKKIVIHIKKKVIHI